MAGNNNSNSDIPNRQPSTWQQYESGGRRGSPASVGSRVLWSDTVSSAGHRSPSRASDSSSRQGHSPSDTLRRRRSSLNLTIHNLRHVGGVNSIGNFARSWQRAAHFHEVAPLRPSFRFAEDGEGDHTYSKGDVEAHSHGARSLLRQAFEQEGRRPSDNVLEDSHLSVDDAQANESTPLRGESSGRFGRIPGSWTDSVFSVEPSLASGFGGSFGTRYGSIVGRPRASSVRRAEEIFNEEQVVKQPEDEGEAEPLLIKQVEEDGVTYNVVVGQSTLPQTIFNSINVLIGIGLLSLPLGLLYSGWIIGVPFFLFAVISTRYTARLLAKCLDVDNSLVTFADLAYVSFGPKARVATSLLFCLELIAACVALVILFADSLNALVPGYTTLTWKLICGIVLVPLSFLPLRFLGFTSVIGIISCLGIFLAVFVDGLIKQDSPGSLISPATTYLFPSSWATVPLSFGLLMSPWGGHSVFPNIYRDMRHPYKYHRALDITYLFTFALDFGMAIVGLLMFGDEVRDEITSNILLLGDAYPEGLSIFIAVCIGIIPLTKVPLNARPIVATVEVIFGLHDMPHAHATADAHPGSKSRYLRPLLRALIRILTIALFVGIAIIFPSFDRIMALMGAVCCFSICIMLPVAFHLKLFSAELSRSEKVANWALLIVSTIMAVVSTVFACLPKEMLEGMS